MAEPADPLIAQFAVESHLLSLDAVQRCLREAARTGKSFVKAAVDAGALSQAGSDDLLSAFHQSGRSSPSACESPSGESGEGAWGRRSADEGHTSGDSGVRRPTLLPPVLHEGDRYAFPAGLGEGTVTALDRRLHRRIWFHYCAAGDPAAFFREARILARLDHAAIPRVHDAGSLGKGHYFTTDELAGGSLGDWLRDSPGGSLSAVLRHLLEVTAALVHAHGRGIAHTRLRPDTVHVGHFGEVWITGWHEASALDGAPPEALRAAGGASPSPPDVEDLAPETRKGLPPTEATDVWGVGSILHWLLVGRKPMMRETVAASLSRARWRHRTLPRELVAITRKALAPAVLDRYPDVRALQDDLRRFLDGRGVEAERDTLAQALARSFRNHPVPAGIASLTLLALVLLGIWTGIRVRASWIEARAAQSLAASGLTVAERESDRARRSFAEARAVLDATRKSQDLEDAVALAIEASSLGAPDSEVLAAFAKSEALARGLGGSALDRFLRARADWQLYRAALPDATGALLDYRELCGRTDDNADAQFGRYLAARALPGDAARREETQALDALAIAEGVFGDLARAALHVQASEKASHEARWLPGGPPRTRSIDRAREEGLIAIGSLQAIQAERVELPFASELLGRCRSAMSGPGNQNALPEGNRYFYGSFEPFILATYLAPMDPFPRVALLTEWMERYGIHQSWRWVSGWLHTRVVEVLPVIRHPHLLVNATIALQDTGQLAGSLTFTKRLMQLDLSPAAASEADRALAPILHARALLANGQRLPDALVPDEVPEAFHAQRAFLLLHDALVAGRDATSARWAEAGLDALPRDALPHLAFGDLLRALRDPRAAPRLTLPILDAIIHPKDTQTGTRLLRAARADVLVRAGLDPGTDLSVLLAPGAPMDDATAPARLAWARHLARTHPSDPRGHAQILDLWSAVNLGTLHDEWLADRARDAIVERLESLGQKAPAAAFANLDAEELWVIRDWMPSSLHQPRSTGTPPGVSPDGPGHEEPR